MKKVFAIIVAVALMLALLPGSAVVAASAYITDFTKEFLEDSAALCTNVTCVMNITTTEAGVEVEDMMPEGLALIAVDIDPETYSDLEWDEEGLTVTLDEAGTYTITIEVRVTDVLAYDDMEVTNTATATASDGSVEASDTIVLEAYEGLRKYLYDAGTDWYVLDEEFHYYGIDPAFDPIDEIPVSTKGYFLIYLDLDNDLNVDMEDARMVDNLPGNVEYIDWYTYGDGTVTEKMTGRTEKAHLVWEIGDLVSSNGVDSDLLVATDSTPGNKSTRNPKPGKQKKSGPGTYTLNPGAKLQFTDGTYGLDCSVQSASVKVDVVPAAP